MWKALTLITALWASAANAQLGAGSVSGPGGGGVVPCTQSIAYIGALPTLPSVLEWTEFTRAICGIVADGNFSSLDGLYFHGNASAANARINVANPGTFNITTNGSCTFTADRGFTGDSSSCYQDPGFNPATAGGNFTQNSAVVGVCILNNRTTTDTTAAHGYTDGVPTAYTFLEPLYTGPVVSVSLNGAPPTDITNTFGTVQGAWTLGRISSVGFGLLRNGINFNNYTNTSTGVASAALIEMAYNGNGTIAHYTGDQHGYWWFGGGTAATGAAITQIYGRLHTMMVALGATGC